jgi:hypothetical protein
MFLRARMSSRARRTQNTGVEMQKYLSVILNSKEVHTVLYSTARRHEKVVRVVYKYVANATPTQGRSFIWQSAVPVGQGSL